MPLNIQRIHAFLGQYYRMLCNVILGFKNNILNRKNSKIITKIIYQIDDRS